MSSSPFPLSTRYTAPTHCPSALARTGATQLHWDGKSASERVAAGDPTEASSLARRCRAARRCAPATASFSTNAAIVVTVVERLEPVFVVEPPTAAEWGLFAYCIGNSHQPLMLTTTAIVCPDVPGMEHVLAYHGIPFSRSTRAFTPVSLGGELFVAGHQHNPERVR